MNLLQNSHYSWKTFVFRRSIYVLQSLNCRRTLKPKQICIWNPMTARLILSTLNYQYIISLEFLLMRHRHIFCKMTQVERSKQRWLYSQATLSIEKILFLQSSSSQNLKAFANGFQQITRNMFQISLQPNNWPIMAHTQILEQR